MRDYQLEGLNWMIRLSEIGVNGILADEMGLGKTLQTISILAYFQEYKNISGPHLVLVPKSTLSNWCNEFSRWCPSLRVCRFHGDKDERKYTIRTTLTSGRNELDRTFDVCVTTYEVSMLERSALSKIAWRYLVVDEAHRLKNEQSQFSLVVREFTTEHRLLITGTPLQNNLHELWALLNFLLPDVFECSQRFDEFFDLATGDDEAKARMIKQLHRVLRPFMLRRLKSDVEKSLPPKVETLLFVRMTPLQKEVYKGILKRDVSMIQSTDSSRGALLNVVMQLRKCCGHPYLFEGVEDRSQDPYGEHLVQNCGKLLLLDKLLPRLKARGSRVLIFSQMTRVLDILEDYCVMRKHLCCRIDGNTSYDDREDSIEAFNAPESEKFIFLLSTRAGGLGINLYTADVVILYDSDWNPQADLQAQDRAHRIGQRKVVNVYRLVTDSSVEEKVVERAQKKLKLDAMVVQQGRLQDKESAAVSKSEMLEMIRFGAEQVFRSSDDGGQVSEEDIDAILSEGAARTSAMADKITSLVQGGADLLDFRMDGGMKVQTFEGVDYSNEAQRRKAVEEELEAQQRLAFIQDVSDSMGKRERKQVIVYQDAEAAGGSCLHARGGLRMPKALKLKKMDEYQLFDIQRLRELNVVEVERWERLSRSNSCQVGSLLSSEEAEEKATLLAEGFGDWSKNDYLSFIRASAKFGRSALPQIAREVGKTVAEVERYAQAFWVKGSKRLSPQEWGRAEACILKGEKKLEAVQGFVHSTAVMVSRFDDPYSTLTFNIGLGVGSGGSADARAFTEEADRFLLSCASHYGYGNWDEVRSAVLNSEAFRFDYYLKSSSTEELGRRCESLMRMAGKENAEAARREVRESTARERVQAEREAAEQAIANAEEHRRNREADVERRVLEEVCRLRAERSASKMSKAVKPSATSKAKQRFNREEGGGKLSAMFVPDDLYCDLAQAILGAGRGSIKEAVRSFVQKYPQVSIRQAEMKAAEIGVKERRDGSTYIMWHLRPEFDHLARTSVEPSGGSTSPRTSVETNASEGVTVPEMARFRSKKRRSSRKTCDGQGLRRVTARSAFELFCQHHLVRMLRKAEQAARICGQPFGDEERAAVQAAVQERWDGLQRDERQIWLDRERLDADRCTKQQTVVSITGKSEAQRQRAHDLLSPVPPFKKTRTS